jgi:hypothetical protein
MTASKAATDMPTIILLNSWINRLVPVMLYSPSKANKIRTIGRTSKTTIIKSESFKS